MTDLAGEIRVALRALRRRTALSFIAVASLGGVLAISLFFATLIDGFLVAPLPYPHASQLVRFTARLPGHTLAESHGVSFPLALDLRAGLESLDGLAIDVGSTGTLVTGDGVQQLQGAVVSENLFAVLGVRPVLGRSFRPEEDAPGSEALVIVSHRLWLRNFGGDPSILGRSVDLADASRTVVGVMPEGFDFPGNEDYWLNLGSADPSRWGRTTWASSAS